MRELAVRIKFISPCLGNVKRQCYVKGKPRLHYLLPRSPNGRVTFLNTWWQVVLKKAADILCRHHSEVQRIRFDLEVEGTPRPLFELSVMLDGKRVTSLQGHFHRYYREDRFVKHEAFFPGTIVVVRCIVPQAISDDDFRRLMELAGRYCGISPGCPHEFGFFSVESLQSTGRGAWLSSGKEADRKEKEPTTS